MNFQDFDKVLPADWKGTVLHEFGHALGFHHEHASPAQACDFNWVKLYEYLAGSPNFWSKRTVDHNLRQLPATGMTFSQHDAKSIMHYSFEDWMFLSGSNSPCYTKPNNVLSPGDKAMAAKAYPFSSSTFHDQDENRKANLVAILAMKDIPPVVKKPYKRHLDYLKKNSDFKKYLSVE